MCRISALMQLGILWCGRDQMRKAKDFLEKSITVYFHFKDEENNQALLKHFLTTDYNFLLFLSLVVSRVRHFWQHGCI